MLKSILFLMLPGSCLAQSEIPSAHGNLDMIWILLSAALVFVMQAGFTCLETGLVRSKNSINVAIKNMMDLCVSGAFYWLFGFGLMFGTTINGWIGSTDFLFAADATPLLTAFFLFQLMFCGTATTIVSGAVAERMSFNGYMTTTAFVSLLIYPVAGHWAWAGAFDGEFAGWLGKSGFIDFAGSTVVHSVGGWCALAAILIIGPRTGRFSEHGGQIPGSNLPVSVLGVFLLWFGWFGFNGGSTLAANAQIPLILLNTCLSAIFAGLSASVCLFILYQKLNVVGCINGILGGLVAITASCHIMTPASAILIGILAGLVVIAGAAVLERLQIDDAVGAVPVHLFAGIWGTLAIPIFATHDGFGTGLGRLQQFQIQLSGVIAIGLYAFLLSFVLLKLVNRFYPLRVTLDAEHQGLNVSEHMASTEIHQLLDSMQQQEQNGDFSTHVRVEPFTEVGEIARQYNNVLTRVNKEISNREQALSAFQASESRKGAILNSSLECIVTINRKGRIQEFNAAAEKCFGLSYQRVIGRSFIDLFVPAEFREEFTSNLNNGFSISSNLALNRHNLIKLQRVHDIKFPAELSITAVDLGLGAVKEFTLNIRDITRRLEIQNKMRHMAFHDALTGLYNRSYFREKLLSEIDFASRNRSCVLVMFLDLDHFKHINDSLGHKAGDKLLCSVAANLKKVVREIDVVCRWGGDEFIILFPGLDLHSAITHKAESILNIMHAPIIIDGRELNVQTSIGIALSSQGKVAADQLIQRADMAMYQAKELGRNTYCFFVQEMEDKVNNRFYFESQFRSAIENDQFLLEYQPKVDCKTGKILGFEALIRWRHPEKSIIAPGVFIPILEESPLFPEITQWVLHAVCRQIRNWLDLGLNVLPVAVNLSARDFLVTDCYQRIEGALNAYDIVGELLELEITETVLAKNTGDCIDLMTKLKTLKIKFSVDDFGTGYSSMSYIKKFPIDTLKIDRAFVNECDIKKEDGAICNAIIALGKSLGLKIIAEGVETPSQLQFLTEMDCDIYQGYLFSRPLPAAEIELLLTEQSVDVHRMQCEPY